MGGGGWGDAEFSRPFGARFSWQNRESRRQNSLSPVMYRRDNSLRDILVVHIPDTSDSSQPSTFPCPPCWWTVNKRSLISSLCLSTTGPGPPAFVHFTIVICVSRDCMKTTYNSELTWIILTWIWKPVLLKGTSFSCVLFIHKLSKRDHVIYNAAPACVAGAGNLNTPRGEHASSRFLPSRGENRKNEQRAWEACLSQKYRWPVLGWPLSCRLFFLLTQNSWTVNLAAT